MFRKQTMLEDHTTDALYPPLKVPGLEPGQMQVFSFKGMAPSQRREIEATANYESEFLLKIKTAPTYLLFQSQVDSADTKEDLRKKLQSKYVERLL